MGLAEIQLNTQAATVMDYGLVFSWYLSRWPIS
jgi:hypothetical protein